MVCHKTASTINKSAGFSKFPHTPNFFFARFWEPVWLIFVLTLGTFLEIPAIHFNLPANHSVQLVFKKPLSDFLTPSKTYLKQHLRQTWKYPVLQTEKSHPVLKFGFQSKSHIFFYLAGRFQTLRFDYKNVLKWDPESRSRFEIQVWNYKKPKILKECPLHEHKNNLKTWISFLDFNLAFCKSPKKNYSVEKIWDRNRKTIKGVLTGKKTHPLNKFFLFRETQISIFDLNFFKTSRINRIRKQTTEFAFAVNFFWTSV